MKRYVVLMLVFGIHVACNSRVSVKQDESKETDYIKISQRQDSLEKQLVKAIETNDQKIYNNVVADYLLAQRTTELLYYSLMMAYKNNCAEAYHNVYEIVIMSSSTEPKETFKRIGKKMEGFALYHLLKSYEMGHKRAIYDIHVIFPEGSIPSSNDYKKYIDAQ